MADPKGFLKYNRELPKSRDPKERIKDYKEIYEDFDQDKTVKQAARCMDCGIPFCHQRLSAGEHHPGVQ
jgi:glutamate synthase (NADPH/NADH) small chain